MKIDVVGSAVAVVLFVGLLQLVAPVFAARETPLHKVPFKGAFLHDGENEGIVPVYIGKGQDRQLLVFCLHTAHGEITEWPVHVREVIDAPESE